MIENVPQLNETEKLQLQNLMLRMSLEHEKINNYETKLALSKRYVKELDVNLKMWSSEFNKKLNEVGLDITKVDIDAETGMVKVLD